MDKIIIEVELKNGTQQLGLSWIVGRIWKALKEEMECGEHTNLKSVGKITIDKTVFSIKPE